MPQAAYRTVRAGFTLIEMIVVLIVFAILAAVAMPKLTMNDERKFKLAIEQTADLLMMYAQRENLGQKPVGILHDRDRNALVLMIYDSGDAVLGQYGEWRQDSFVRPVALPAFMNDTDVELYADGERIDASDAPLSNELGQDRPTIDLVLRGAGQSATLTLYPYGVSPQISDGDVADDALRARIDLDASGRSREDW